jgi:integrase
MPIVNLARNGLYWQARWRDSTGRQRSRGLGATKKISERTAEARCRRLQAELDAGRMVNGEPPALGCFLDRWLADQTDLSDGTVALYEQTILYLKAHFGDATRLNCILRDGTATFRSAIAKGELAGQNKRDCGAPSESTVCRHMRECKRIFGDAARQDMIPFNPFDRLKSTAPVPDKSWRYVTLSELDRLLSVCPTPAWRLLLALCRLAGLRQGEALRLEWADVDFERKRLIVRNPGTVKTTKKRTRELPTQPKLAGILFEAFMEGHGQLVVDPTGLPTQKHLFKAFQTLCRRAGLDPWDRWCHTLRKNAEADWLAVYPVLDVCGWLGHSPEVAQKHYHKTKDETFDAAAGIVNPPNEYKTEYNKDTAKS